MEDRIIKSLENQAEADDLYMLLICIMGKMDGNIYGEMICYDDKEPVSFQSRGDLIFKLGNICTRKEKEESRWRATHFLSEENSLECYPTAFRAKEVLTVCVKSSQHYSMHGIIKGRMTKGRYICFQNALELLHIIGKVV